MTVVRAAGDECAPSADEIAYATKLLRSAGYTVTPPLCPECYGRGWTNVVADQVPGSYGVSQRPCSRGCRAPSPYNGRPIGAVVEARATGTRTHPL